MQDLPRFRRCSSLHGHPVDVTVGYGVPSRFLQPTSEDPGSSAGAVGDHNSNETNQATTFNE